MNLALKKYTLILGLCLALVGLPIALGGCSNLKGSSMDMGKTFPLGSSNNPYSIAVSQGACTAWSLTMDQGNWCASTVPATLHTGDEVKLSYGVAFQLVVVDAVDPTHHLVTLESIG
jgi:hypothetical protein